MKEYRIVRNNVTSEIRTAQTNYYRSKKEENNGHNKSCGTQLKLFT